LLVLIRCRWFRFAAVGLDSPSLVSSGPGWFPRCLITPSPRRLAPPSPRVACSPSPHIAPSLSSRPSSISPLVLLIVSPPPHRPSPSTLVPSPFLIVVISSSLRRRIAPHRRRFGVSIRPSDRVEASVRGIRRWISKTNHDKCHGSYFVTHKRGFPLLRLFPSPPGSSVERD